MPIRYGSLSIREENDIFFDGIMNELNQISINQLLSQNKKCLNFTILFVNILKLMWKHWNFNFRLVKQHLKK